jgi:hypothetical protein
MIEFILGGVVLGPTGLLVGIWLARRTVTEAANKEIGKYRERWQSAVKLLQVEGKITDEQYEELLAKPEPKQISSNRSERQLIFDEMYSEDRADLEVARAKQGLPPEDDLQGMWSEDIARVMKARIKNAGAIEFRQRQQSEDSA